jgi:polyketide synthase PksN
LEDAGYTPDKLVNTGVFMSASNSFYHALMPSLTSTGTQVLENSNQYVSWILAQGGSIPAIVSHRLGLTGPSFFIHSNCSSSLAGLYTAYQCFVNGEVKAALVGGTSISASSYAGYLYQKGLNFSSDGHCRAFDAEADGMVAGEGVCVILVKSVIDAIRDKDHIYAVLRGINANNDGADKAGFYAPGVKGQADVIVKTLEKTGINPETIGYLEAHGTGTIIGG